LVLYLLRSEFPIEMHKMEIQNIVIIALIGIVAGLLGGMLGLGGAIIIIPALMLFLGYSQQLAQGTALIMMVLPVGALAAFQYYQKGFVDFKAALILAGFFFAGSYFGARFATQIPQEILRKVFAVMLVGIALKMWFQK
jgi:uncharacterized membrane protein YfcA